LPLFVLTCLDKPNSLEVRMAAREAHIAYVRANHPHVLKLGGPFLDAEGQMCGSMLIVEAADLAAAKAFSAADPYTTAGLFESVEIRPFRVVTGAL
jgi:uncharacterized protein YciI